MLPVTLNSYHGALIGVVIWTIPSSLPDVIYEEYIKVALCFSEHCYVKDEILED